MATGKSLAIEPLISILVANSLYLLIDSLTITDLKDVKSALWSARAKWKDIGTCIGVDAGTLDTLKGNDGDCFGEMLKYWLRGVYDTKKKNSKPRTWRTLIEALRDEVVNEGEMADKLEKEKYPPQGI